MYIIFCPRLARPMAKLPLCILYLHELLLRTDSLSFE